MNINISIFCTSKLALKFLKILFLSDLFRKPPFFGVEILEDPPTTFACVT